MIANTNHNHTVQLMARSTKNAQHIVVDEVAYHWRATGNDGYITVTIWPANNIGPAILGNIEYHETWIADTERQSYSSAGDQIVITNRIILRIINVALSDHGYDPQTRGKELNLRAMDHLIDWKDAIRATRKNSTTDPDRCPES